jgi:hypothetical protein
MNQVVLDLITDHHELHMKWLDTLSYIENLGARKLSFLQDPLCVSLDILKHAAEESRHAYYFKKKRTDLGGASEGKIILLGGSVSKNYLRQLDLKILKLLKTYFPYQTKEDRDKMSYVLTTYASERRVGELYSDYQDIIEKKNLKLNLRTILAEEKQHLKEMEKKIIELNFGHVLKEKALQIEDELFKRFLKSIYQDSLNWVAKMLKDRGQDHPLNKKNILLGHIVN